MTGRWMRALLPGLLAALFLAATPGCKRRSSPARGVAQLIEVRGQVEIEPAGQGAWNSAARGAALAAGDALRTGAGAAARLRFSMGQEVSLHEHSLLRLGSDPDSSVHVSIELGQAEIEGDGDLRVATGRGLARLLAGSRMRVLVDDAGSRYEVVVGRAVLGEGPEAMILAAGEGLRLRVGDAQMERYRIEVGTAEVEPEPRSGPVAADAAAGPVPAARAPAPPGHGTGPVDVSLAAGESAIIHAAQIPVAVRLRLPHPCPAPALLRLEGPGLRRRQPVGQTEARFVLAPGAHRYRIDCPGAPPVTGRLEVKRDAGRSRLARRAPMNVIETDGRRYTVLYQNRLPSLTLTWPGAPRSSAYTLHVSTRGEERTYQSEEAALHLASGALAEGAHSLWFSADGEPAKASPRTAVTIRFDNAAVTAEIDRPRDGAPVGAEAVVEVAGVALQGSTVAVGEAPLAIDEQGRFSGQVPGPRGDERSIAIRLQHPRGGVHYYIRRVASGGASTAAAPR